MNDIVLPASVDPAIASPPPPSLDHLSLLVARGVDARSFLDSQLTRNVPSAAGTPGDACVASLAGYCSPKGRLLASFTVWDDGDAIHMVVSRDIAEVIARRLKMYVLRAKATIDDRSASHRLDGFLASDDLPAAVAALDTWSAVKIGDRSWVRYPDANGRRRYLRVSTIDPDGDDVAGAVDAAVWRWLDIRAGLARITVATQDRFVPQMLNLEALGAVDFRKGCFPGQEVVARSQYLGKLKRRMALASCDALDVPVPGSDVWKAGEHEPSGLVVDAERGPDGRVALLGELPLALFASDDLRVGGEDGAPLIIEPLPYALPDNEVFVRPKL